MNKDNYISIAKALGIILMLIGHAIEQNFAYRFIYIFHMPLFFICSGYFFNVPTSVIGIRRFVWRRIRSLYIPFIKWGVVFLLLHNYFCDLCLYNHNDTTYYFYSDYIHRLRSILFSMTGQEQLIDPLWFLKQLLLSSLLICFSTYLFRKSTYRYKDILYLLLLIMITVVSKYYKWGIPLIWDLSIVTLSSIFVYFGFLFKKIDKPEIYSFGNFIFSLIIVLFVVWIYNDFLDMLWYNYLSVLLFIPAALAGVYMVFCVSRMIEKWPVRRIFYYIGNHTMMILVLHLLVFKVGNLLKILVYNLSIERLSDFKVITEHNEFFWMIYVILGCLVPLFIDYCLSKMSKKELR